MVSTASGTSSRTIARRRSSSARFPMGTPARSSSMEAAAFMMPRLHLLDERRAPLGRRERVREVLGHLRDLAVAHLADPDVAHRNAVAVVDRPAIAHVLLG